jgi:hypothetical protein
MSLALPASTEHSSYFSRYLDTASRAVAMLEGGTVLDLLTLQPVALRAMVDGVDDESLHRAYAPGKWTLAESLVHVADTERVFSYRMLHVARGDTAPLPSFDQDAWVPFSGASMRTLSEILTEIDVVRASTLSLAHSLSDEAFLRVGTAGGNPVSARAMVWIIAGHFAHHLEITRDRYLGSPATS